MKFQIGDTIRIVRPFNFVRLEEKKRFIFFLSNTEFPYEAIGNKATHLNTDVWRFEERHIESSNMLLIERAYRFFYERDYEY